MRSFFLRILAADRPFYEGECTSLIIPTEDGLYGIMAGHRNITAAVVPGVLTLRKPDGSETVAAVSSGILVSEDGNVLVLVETAELPEEIDINLAEREAADAKEAMLQKRSIQEYYLARDKMARELNRLKIKNTKYQ